MTEEAFYKLARPLMRGVKVSIVNGEVNVRNRMVRDILGGQPQFTGEIVVGNPIDTECRERTEAFLDDEQWMLPFIFWVYDMKTTDSYSLLDRLKIAETMIIACHPCIQYVDHDLLTTRQELDSYAQKVVTENLFPGIVLREPFGTYGTYDEEIPAESLGSQLH